MKGLWKENIGGWNNKDSKRKKQTRNNTLRDNGTYVIRTFNGWNNKNEKVNPDIFRSETKTIKTFTGGYGEIKPILTEVRIYRVCLSWRVLDENGEFIKDERTFSGFKEIYRETSIFENENLRRGIYNDTWNVYSSITNESIADFLKLEKKQTWSLNISSKRFSGRTMKLPENLIEKAIKRKNKVTVEDFQEDGDFIYNKPLPDWKRLTFFNDGKRRKIAQNHANRMDRRNIKAWLNKHDISIEVKTHALSKSILWEIW